MVAWAIVGHCLRSNASSLSWYGRSVCCGHTVTPWAELALIVGYKCVQVIGFIGAG
jgi:hypothetical protein